MDQQVFVFVMGVWETSLFQVMWCGSQKLTLYLMYLSASNRRMGLVKNVFWYDNWTYLLHTCQGIIIPVFVYMAHSKVCTLPWCQMTDNIFYCYQNGSGQSNAAQPINGTYGYNLIHKVLEMICVCPKNLYVIVDELCSFPVKCVLLFFCSGTIKHNTSDGNWGKTIKISVNPTKP